jgi:hypothetical protein
MTHFSLIEGRLFILFLLLLKLGVCCCDAMPAAPAPSSAPAADLGSSQEIVGEPASAGALVPSTGRRTGASRSSMKHGGQSIVAATEDDGQEACWLCEVADDRNLVQYKGHTVHEGCKSAWRLHDRIISQSTPAAKASDAKTQRDELPEWKLQVLELHPPEAGHRKRGAVEAYKANIETIHEDSVKAKQVLVNKTRFKHFKREWDGMSSESASEEFDEALANLSQSEESDKEGKPQLWLDKPLEKERKTGVRRTTPRDQGEGERRVRRRDDADTRNSSQSARRRSDEGRRSDRGRGRDRRSKRTRSSDAEMETQEEEGREAAASEGRQRRPRWRQLSASSPTGRPSGAAGSGSGNKSSSPKSSSVNSSKAGSKNETGVGATTHRHSKKGRPFGVMKAKGGSAEVLEVPEEDSQQDEPGPTAFLAAKSAMEKQVVEEQRKMGLKTAMWNSLSEIVKKLNADQLDQLRRLGDYAGLLNTFQTIADEFTHLQDTLADVVPSTVEGWESKLAVAIVDLADATKKGGDQQHK